MAEVSFNTIETLREAFPALASKQFFKIEPVQDLVSEGIGRLSGNTFKPAVLQMPTYPELRSHLGTPVFFPMLLKGGSYDYFNDGQIMQRNLADFTLPYTSTAEFNRQKIITKSKPNGRQGSVKELWSFDDWQISIRGLLIDNDPQQFPQRQLESLLAFESLADSVEVVGDLFNYLGIQRITIERIAISQVKGKPHVIPFLLECSSDEDLEIVINQNT